MTTTALQALHRAIRFPENIADIWAERIRWQERLEERAAREPDYAFPVHVQARISGLENLLENKTARTVSDIRSRLKWLEFIALSEALRSKEQNFAFARRLGQDYELLVTSYSKRILELTRQQPQSVIPPSDSAPQTETRAIRRTNADKRDDVLAKLRSDPDASCRTIADQCQVSPQTVANHRRRLKAGLAVDGDQN